jgi:hypothetical protein
MVLTWGVDSSAVLPRQFGISGTCGVRIVRLASASLLAVALLGTAWSLPAAAGQMPDGTAVTEEMAGVSMQQPGGCGCQSGTAGAYQQPPWHGNVQACQAPCGQPTCRGSNVFQAHPFAQLHSRDAAGCVTLPPCLPRLHAFFREGYMPSPQPPVLPRCHQCGAPIAGGF